MANSTAEQRFYELIWPHRVAIARAARIQTGNAAEAEDMAQETLLKAFKAIDSFRKGSNPTAWLMMILRNARIDSLRTRDGSARHLSLRELPEELISVAPQTEEREAIWQNPESLLDRFSDAQIIDALQGVSEELRWTLMLVDVEGLDHAGAASILAVPPGTIKSRLHRARASLRKALLPLARDRRLVSE